MHRCSLQFSLIELFVVLIIAGILLSLAIPAFLILTGASSVDSAAKKIGSAIAMARQLSVARKKYVAVIMPGSNASSIKEDYRYACYRLAYVAKSGSDYQFLSWRGGSAWELLPKGTTIMEADADIGINQTGTPSLFSKQPADNSYTKVGDVDLNGGGLNGNTDVDDVRAVVFSPKGKLKGDSRYVTVGEAVFINTFWNIKNPDNDTSSNLSCANQFTIEINRFSGAVKYLLPVNY